MKTKTVKPSSDSALRQQARTLLNIYPRYLGVLGLLGDCSVYVPEDIREMIEQAFEDACAVDPDLKWRRILDCLEIEAFDFERPVGASGDAPITVQNPIRVSKEKT